MGKRLARVLGWTLLCLLLIALGSGAARWHAVVARLHDYAWHHPCAPVTWWLQEHVPELEPLPRADCPSPSPSPEMQALQAETARLTQQLQEATRERDRLNDLLKDDDREPKFAVGAEVVDAFTGKRLNASNAPTGQ